MKNDILALVNNTIQSTKDYAEKYKLSPQHELLRDVLRVLDLMRNELLSDSSEINERVLRSFKDVATLIAIQYEDTPINEHLFNLYDTLNIQIGSFKNLEPLRMEFGKGNPI